MCLQQLSSTDLFRDQNNFGNVCYGKAAGEAQRNKRNVLILGAKCKWRFSAIHSPFYADVLISFSQSAVTSLGVWPEQHHQEQRMN